MVLIEDILSDVLQIDAYEYSKPFCNLKYYKKVMGIEFNVVPYYQTAAVYINFKHRYLYNKDTQVTVFGHTMRLTNYVYGCLYTALALYLFSLKYEVPLLVSFLITQKDKPEIPKNYTYSMRYVSYESIHTGKLILETWIAQKRKENPYFTLET